METQLLMKDICLNETETVLGIIDVLFSFSPSKLFAECLLVLEQKALLKI